jgi:hypothetical protein
MLQKVDSGQKIMNATAMLVILFIASTVFCAKLFRKHGVIEPVRIVLVDESRAENNKVRHIFREFLLKGLIDQGRHEIEIIDLDSLDGVLLEKLSIDYLVVFDIMDFGTWDIERGTEKVLASVKIMNHIKDMILDSFIAGARDDKLEIVCWKTADKLSKQVVKRLVELRKTKEKMLEQLNTGQDSL